MNKRDLFVEIVGSDLSGLSGSSGPGNMASHCNIGMKLESGKVQKQWRFQNCDNTVHNDLILSGVPLMSHKSSCEHAPVAIYKQQVQDKCNRGKQLQAASTW